MAKVKVKVGMYQATANCLGEYEGTVISAEDYDLITADRVEELKKDRNEFGEWLSNSYTIDEIWDMTDEDKAKVREIYGERCKDWAVDDLNDEWNYIEIETEVEVEVPVVCPCNQ